jgi:hypothetical protein
VACLVLGLVSPFAVAGADPDWTYIYRALTAHDPDEYSVLKLREITPTTYVMDFSIVAPNRTHHTGHIEGVATLTGDVLVLKPAPIHGDPVSRKCELKLRIAGKTATVLSEDSCAGYAGSAASFVEQGANLQR